MMHISRKPILKRGVVITLILCMVLFSLTAHFAAVHSQDISSIQNQINDINNQIIAKQADINSLQNEANSLLSKKNSLLSTLYTVQNLLTQAQAKENQITALIQNLQSLKSAAEKALAQKTTIKDNALAKLYETSRENPLLLFISSTDAKAFLNNLALGEANLDDQKNQIVDLNNQIISLQDSLDQEAHEKVTQENQIQAFTKEQSDLRAQLLVVQHTVSTLNSQISNNKTQLLYLQAQYGALNTQEQLILNEKLNGGESFGNTGSSSVPGVCTSLSQSPGGVSHAGAAGSFTVAQNGKVLANGIQGPITLLPNTIADYASVKGNGKVGCYTGDLEFRSDTNVNFINQNFIENYVQGIGEIPATWNMNTLEAQAIAARTYALYHKGENAGEHYDISDGTSDLVYLGYQGGTKYQAGVGTYAKTMYSNGKLLDAFFSANNGGYERSNQEIWGTSGLSYLPSQSDGAGSNEYNNVNDPGLNICPVEFFHVVNPTSWGGTNGLISLNDGMGSFPEIAGIALALMQGTQASQIDLNNPSQYSSQFHTAVGIYQSADFSFTGGRSANTSNSSSQIYALLTNGGNTDSLSQIVVHGSSGNTTISASSFYLAFNLASPGKDYFTSPTWFFINSGGGNVTFYNFGFGHSIGMSQCGAEGRAEAGQDYNTILNFYYNSPSIQIDPQIVGLSNPTSCFVLDSSALSTDACIRIGIDGYSSNDNIIQEHDTYTIYANGNKITSGAANDTIEIVEN